jgi:hypothetical protein
LLLSLQALNSQNLKKIRRSNTNKMYPEDDPEIRSLLRPWRRLVTDTRYDNNSISALDTVVSSNVIATYQRSGGEREEAKTEVDTASRATTQFVSRGRVPAS